MLTNKMFALWHHDKSQTSNEVFLLTSSVDLITTKSWFDSICFLPSYAEAPKYES